MRILWALAVLGSSLAWGQGLVKGLTAKEAVALLREMGVAHVQEDQTTFLLELRGLKFVLLKLELCEGVRCSLLSLSAGFRHKVTLERINEWNRNRRFSRAYLDAEEDPWVEWELDLAGGVSWDAVKRFFRLFLEAVLPLFMEHIGFKP